MTVAELITELQQYPADLPVDIDQGDAGPVDVDRVVLDATDHDLRVVLLP